MKMRFLGYSVVIVAAMGTAGAASAQRMHSRWHTDDSRMYFDYGNPVMASVIQSPDGHTADVRLTTANTMFSFLHGRDGKYFAVRDLTVEVDEEGNPQPVVTKNRIDTLWANSFDESTSKTTWHALSEPISLATLDSGKHYTLHVEVRDDIDKMVLHPQPFELRVPKFSNTATSAGIELGDIQLMDSSSGSRFYASGQSNTYMFGSNVTGSVAFRLAPALGSDPMVDVTVRQVTNAIDPADTGERYHAALDISDLHQAQAMSFAGSDSILQYKLVPEGDSQEWTAIFHIPGQQFQQGNYAFSVRVRSGNVERTQTNNFQLLWQNMPLSLEDPTDAIDPLPLIATPEQIQAINSGSKQEMTQKLYAFWHKQDPTPNTVFNKRMATFYQRVDYADFNFATGNMLNGAMTDRGRVYLLYGPPTNIERTFIPGDAPTETWTYANNVNRVFHFEERNGQGNYQLTDMKDLNVAAKN